MKSLTNGFSDGVPDSLAVAEAALRAAWEVCYRREKPT
jgi:hypothetical protein